jgi:hypothetical protein
MRNEEIVLDNDILLAATYVDPMYRVTLTKSPTAKPKPAFVMLFQYLFFNKTRIC